ncbi:uncharacterized protein At5g23160-like [Lycium ferocissimum]|uniref:uncharacterized protein At5g23160-like n=1 Tax=Lycium ferocissimum TaxID=112874 RepID=UPI0028165726|nr:uncharacterized protein At5g23160-like [Lycium ferocissimum]
MALNIQNSPKKKQPKKFKISWFLSCFGFNNQQKGKAKTVPVGAEKLNTSREIHVLKSEKKAAATTVYVPDQVPVTAEAIHFNKAKCNKHEDIIPEQSKKIDHLQHSSCQKGLLRSFTIANSIKRGSPEDKHEISRTVSLPPPTKRNKQPVFATNKIDEGKDTFNFDSVIGMSVLMVTLIIMLFWGKFCAILCTSAWFYFLPRFRAKNEAEQNDGNLDVLNSNEYKKKVVLNGFLERDHRNGLGF